MKMKIDKKWYQKWLETTNTQRRKDLTEMRESDVIYISTHTEIPLIEIAKMPDSIITDLAYDLRFVYED